MDAGRPTTRSGQVFARVKYQFTAPASSSSNPTLFGRPGRPTTGRDGRSATDSPALSPAGGKGRSQTEGPYLQVEARIPDPPILTLNTQLPLQIMVNTLNEKFRGMTLTSLHLDLAQHLHVKAQEIQVDVPASQVLFTQSNMVLPLEFDPDSGQAIVPPELWYGVMIPPAIPPTFEICNIGTSYTLLVRIGLRWDGAPANVRIAQFFHHSLSIISIPL